jgi:ribosomal protein L3
MKIYQDRVCREEFRYVFCIVSPENPKKVSCTSPMSGQLLRGSLTENETLIYEVDHGKKSQEDIS